MSQEPAALCRLDDIPEGEARGFAVDPAELGEPEEPGGRPLDLLIARRGEAVFGYVNSCPHVGSPLDWTPDRFMSPDRRHLMCGTHGALFRIEDGFCVHGPCAGKQLRPIALVLSQDGVVRPARQGRAGWTER